LTIKLIVRKPKGKIVKLELPAELYEGEWITGKVHIKNVGDATGEFRMTIWAYWEGRWYVSKSYDIPPGSTFVFEIVEGELKMPGEDARMLIRAEHSEIDPETGAKSWVVDDKVEH